MKATVYILNPTTREWRPVKTYPHVDNPTYQRLQGYAEEFANQVKVEYEPTSIRYHQLYEYARIRRLFNELLANKTKDGDLIGILDSLFDNPIFEDDPPLKPEQDELITVLCQALEGWEELAHMRPLDSGADIAEIFDQCWRRTQHALEQANRGVEIK